MPDNLLPVRSESGDRSALCSLNYKVTLPLLRLNQTAYSFGDASPQLIRRQSPVRR